MASDRPSLVHAGLAILLGLLAATVHAQLPGECDKDSTCTLVVEAVGDSITEGSTYRAKLQAKLPNLSFVGPRNSKGTRHAGYSSYTTAAVVHGCPG